MGHVYAGRVRRYAAALACRGNALFRRLEQPVRRVHVGARMGIFLVPAERITACVRNDVDPLDITSLPGGSAYADLLERADTALFCEPGTGRRLGSDF